MEFVVVTDPQQDTPYAHPQTAPVKQDRCQWPYGTVHLMVAGSEVTLCAEPASRFVPVAPVSAEDVDCELCRLTALT